MKSRPRPKNDPGNAYKGLFAWHCRDDGTQIDANNASDGEEWFVTALFFASRRWGDGAGIYNYRAEAQKILDTMLHKEVNGQPVDSTTNMFDAATHLVNFVPNLESRSLSLTDPSYHLPHFYEMWARWADKDNAFWCEAARASRQYLRRAAHPVTGLTADYTTFDGTPKATWWNRGANAYRFDSFRVAGNVFDPILDELLQLFLMEDPFAYSTVQLKQFRDLPSGTCFQAVVATPFEPLNIGVPQPLPPVTITVHDYASLDIPGSLGFESGKPLQPSLQYSISLDMRMGQGINLFVNE